MGGMSGGQNSNIRPQGGAQQLPYWATAFQQMQPGRSMITQPPQTQAQQGPLVSLPPQTNAGPIVSLPPPNMITQPQPMPQPVVNTSLPADYGFDPRAGNVRSDKPADYGFKPNFDNNQTRMPADYGFKPNLSDNQSVRPADYGFKPSAEFLGNPTTKLPDNIGMVPVRPTVQPNNLSPTPPPPPPQSNPLGVPTKMLNDPQFMALLQQQMQQRPAGPNIATPAPVKKVMPTRPPVPGLLTRR